MNDLYAFGCHKIARKNLPRTFSLPSQFPEHLYTFSLLSYGEHNYFPIDFQGLHIELQSNETIWMQVVREHVTDRYKENIVYAYLNWLDGVEKPSLSRPIRWIQKEMAKVQETYFRSITKKNKPNPLIEEKLQDDLYLADIKIGIDAEEHRIQRIYEDIFHFFQYTEQTIHSVQIKHTPFVRSEWDTPKLEGTLLLSEAEIQNVARMFRPNVPSIGQREDVEYVEAEIVEDIPVHAKQSEEIIEVQRTTEAKPVVDTIRNTNEITQLLPAALPVTDTKEDDEEFVSLFRESLANYGIVHQNKKEQIALHDVIYSPRLRNVLIKIPNNLAYKKIKSQEKNLQTAMGYKGLSILQSNLPHTIMICTSRKTPKIISLRECFEHPTFIDYEGTLKMVIGFDMDNNLVILDLLKEYHILICGETGSGKSVFLGNVLLSLLIHNSAEDLRFYLVDPKMVELNIYKEFPHVDEFISDMEDAKKLLYRLCREMDRRYEVLKKHDKRHISQIQPMYPGEYPYLICVIDELADLLMQEPNAEGYIIRLSQKARACGIHLILCTQKPSKEVLSSSIKSNMPTRLGFRCNASSDYVTIFGHTIPFEQLLGGGDGVMKSRNKQEMVRFQSPKVRPILEAEDEEDIVIDIGRAMSAQMQKGRFKLLSIEELKEKEADEETEKDPTLH